MNKLLIPFDFSVYAENALLYAVSLARRIEASVTIFHSMPVLIPAGYEDTSLNYNMAVANKEKSNVIVKIKESLSIYAEAYYVGTSNPVQFDIEVRHADLEEGLDGYLKHNKHSLVVMGTKGMHGWEGVLDESNTASISKELPASMVVVPFKALFTGVAHIVYASNFDAKDLRVLQELTAFNELFGGRITCLHVAKNSEAMIDARKRMSALTLACEKHGLNDIKFEIIVDKNLEKGLFDYAKDESVDLLVAKPQTHGVVESLFHKSVTKQLTHHTDIPLLIVK